MSLALSLHLHLDTVVIKCWWLLVTPVMVEDVVYRLVKNFEMEKGETKPLQAIYVCWTLLLCYIPLQSLTDTYKCKPLVFLAASMFLNNNRHEQENKSVYVKKPQQYFYFSQTFTNLQITRTTTTTKQAVWLFNIVTAWPGLHANTLLYFIPLISFKPQAQWDKLMQGANIKHQS